jgi:putative ABC transport system ATP-binding protein
VSYLLSGRNVAPPADLINKLKSQARSNWLYVFQSFNLLPRLTVIENVALPLAYRGVSHTKFVVPSWLAQLLERSWAERSVNTITLHSTEVVVRPRAWLSPGRLINDPPIIIADEPTGNLDSGGSPTGYGATERNSCQLAPRSLLVTHNPELTRYASRVVYMHDGSIIHDETTKIGEVAPTAKRLIYFLPRTTEEDDLAGVSALMKAIPGTDKETKKKAPAKKRKTEKKTTRRKPRTTRRRT